MTLDAGSTKRSRAGAPEYAGLRIPTLEEVFQRYGKRINYYIETKSPETADRMEERLLALMDKYGLRKPAAVRWQVLIQSFSPASLQKIHRLDPSLPLIQLNSVFDTSELLRAQLESVATYAVGIGPFLSSVDRRSSRPLTLAASRSTRTP